MSEFVKDQWNSSILVGHPLSIKVLTKPIKINLILKY